MADLVTMAEARSHLRLDSGTADDVWLAIFIPAISEAVANWLKDPWRPYVPEEDSGGILTDSSGDPIPSAVVKWSVKAAVLVELASQYRYREGEGTDNVVTPDAGHGYVLNKASTALLQPLRKTTVA